MKSDSSVTQQRWCNYMKCGKALMVYSIEQCRLAAERMSKLYERIAQHHSTSASCMHLTSSRIFKTGSVLCLWAAFDLLQAHLPWSDQIFALQYSTLCTAVQYQQVLHWSLRRYCCKQKIVRYLPCLRVMYQLAKWVSSAAYHGTCPTWAGPISYASSHLMQTVVWAHNSALRNVPCMC